MMRTGLINIIDIINEAVPSKEGVDGDAVEKKIYDAMKKWCDSFNDDEIEVLLNEGNPTLEVHDKHTEIDGSSLLYCIRAHYSDTNNIVVFETELDIIDYEESDYHYNDVARILGKLNQNLERGAFYRSRHSFYYRDALKVDAENNVDFDELSEIIYRSMAAYNGFKKYGTYALDNEAFISSVKTAVPRVDHCDECFIDEDGYIVVKNFHTSTYLLSAAGNYGNPYGCVFVDMNGYVVVSPDWYSKEYVYLINKRLEWGSEYEDVELLKRALDVFEKSYAKIERIDKRNNFRFKPTDYVRNILGEGVVILETDFGRSFLAPKEMGYIIDKFSEDRMDEWKIIHRRWGFFNNALTEDECELEWIRKDEGDEE